jgi:hypothetical protein
MHGQRLILFCFGFLLLKPKVGGRMQKNCFSHALNFQDLCLELYVWLKTNFFCSQHPILDFESRKLTTKKFA